jgi:DNA-binding NtrC family response regulator
MMKRLVILQDEQLVIREIARSAKPVAAYATAGVAADMGRSPAPASIPDEFEADADEELPAAGDAAPASASRLADVAKAAAQKAERALIEDTLQQVRWNRRRAAEQLGVSYKTLLNKIKECGISRA